MAARWKAKLNGNRFLVFLYGEPDSGKSTLLKEFGTLLCHECDSYSDSRIMIKGKNTTDREMRCARNGVNIAIRTIGDAIGDVKYTIGRFLSSNEDVVITASRWSSVVFLAKCSLKEQTIIKNTFTICDIPSRKCVMLPRGCTSYTTARELYLHLIHLLKTGSFK